MIVLKPYFINTAVKICCIAEKSSNCSFTFSTFFQYEILRQIFKQVIAPFHCSDLEAASHVLTIHCVTTTLVSICFLQLNSLVPPPSPVRLQVLLKAFNFATGCCFIKMDRWHGENPYILYVSP